MISVRFLGTGGARFVVARQLRASGGFWLRFSGLGEASTQIHVDPGPGALVRALSCVPPCEPRELDAIALSHKHLDHAGDVNAMIEAMTQGGWRPRGTILAPRDAFEGEPVIFPYARKFVPAHAYLEPQAGPFAVNDVELRTSLAHRHSVETYGMNFRYGATTLSYVPCGRYFDALVEDYASHRPDVVIVNVLRFEAQHEADHLTFGEAKRLIAGIRPKVAVITHFGTTMLEQGPERLARELEDELGLRVHAARDGWTLDVDTEIAAAVG
jgi:phosphoribosyl 1,2-cyclic phosphodiesterase